MLLCYMHMYTYTHTDLPMLHILMASLHDRKFVIFPCFLIWLCRENENIFQLSFSMIHRNLFFIIDSLRKIFSALELVTCNVCKILQLLILEKRLWGFNERIVRFR